MQWPKPMITRLLPSPKTASLLQLIDPYIEENASSSSSWHSSDKYWGLENRKSCPILEVLINFPHCITRIPIVFLTSFGDYLSLHIFRAPKVASTTKNSVSLVLSSSQIVWIACMHTGKIPGFTAMNCSNKIPALLQKKISVSCICLRSFTSYLVTFLPLSSSNFVVVTTIWANELTFFGTAAAT